MMLINILAAIILFLSFFGGFFQGAVKSFFSLLSFIIAVPVAGRVYPFIASLLSFLPGENWENFIGFFIALAIVSIILAFVFYLPRKIMEKVWSGGILFRLAGGILNLLGAAIGLVVLASLISTYPVWDWLQQAMTDASIIQWMVSNLGFIRVLLPDLLQRTVIKY
jgi:uncharacterized membrane protein required for colicin V production